MASSTTLITPTASSTPKPLTPFKSKPTNVVVGAAKSNVELKPTTAIFRRSFLSLSAGILLPAGILLGVGSAANAAEEEEYVKETAAVISKVKSTINMDRNDPAVATAVAELRDSSNFWVAKYRKEKTLLGRPSFRDVYSALNAVSGHYISFGPTAPIPAKRKQRILEEVETAEKALLRGR